MMKIIWTKLKGWKTILLNIVLSILPILNLTEFREILPDSYLPWYALLVAVLNVWVRTLTTTPVGQK